LGLRVGELDYEPDIALNAILKVKKDGRILTKGSMISKDSKIDLVLGAGLNSGKVKVPYVIGLAFSEVQFAMIASQLNIGGPIPDETVTDTLEAIVYKQYPMPSDVRIPRGESVDVWITHPDNFEKMNIERIPLNEIDSTFKNEATIDDGN
ncbi:MAG: hypothetical protein HN600_07750, partial [Bacteroidetes bacterium]|nr:hypothetical protein [Bacteroidota bacterium]